MNHQPSKIYASASLLMFGYWSFSGVWCLGFGASFSFFPSAFYFRSQPKSVHGAGTVRPWAAVNLCEAQGRHNVSARDGGILASRRSGAGVSPVHAPPGLSTNAPPTTMNVHSFIPPFIHPADAVLSSAGASPQIHRPAAAAGLTSLHVSVIIKSSLGRINLNQAETRLINHLQKKIF